jgi:LysM repeat protein
MDTLSRDSSSSSNIVPIAGVFAGVIALILSIAALVQVSGLKKTVTAQADTIAKIPDLENQVRATATKSETDLKNLQAGIQGAFDKVGGEIGAIKDTVAKLQEAAKKPAAAAGGKGGAVATGVMNADGTYTIGAGDTLAKVARKFGVRVDAIEAENPGINSAHLKVGQKIRVPKK